MKLLIIVATDFEAQAFQSFGQVVVSGVGSTAAALATWRTLSAQSLNPPDLVVSAGIAGAYTGLQVGDVAIARQMVQADLGAWDNGFLSLEALGLSIHPTRKQAPVFETWKGSANLAIQTGAYYGSILTVNTVTGSTQQAQLLQDYWQGIAEGMEGAGVAHAAFLSGIPVLEIRGISNMAGPRDRASWRIPEALSAAAKVLQVLSSMSTVPEQTYEEHSVDHSPMKREPKKTTH